MIDIKNVSKTYSRTSDKQRVMALDDISFTIEKGEFVSLVGHSGAGKSTMVRLLTGEEKPDQGEIRIVNRNIADLLPKELPYYRRKIGVIFQDFRLLPHKTVWENVAFALEVCDVPNSEITSRVPKILNLVGLNSKANSYPFELSGGEKQRVAIARAMVHGPRILIADEPTGNLDPVTTAEIIELLELINRRGTTVILATHDKNVVDGLHKRVVALDYGKVISDQQIGRYVTARHKHHNPKSNHPANYHQDDHHPQDAYEKEDE